ncbi:hypothetical protein DSD19_04590 [Rhodovulum sp. BSW8]|nr:hypothetical protein DSD19_04590 [Rhodovulum sp. BSW8]
MLDGPPCVVTDTLVARIAHEVNRAYCQHIGESQPSWANAPEWMVESALAGVRAHLDTARSPEESHALWMDHKLREGWKWGPVKDPAAKEHPCLVPYDHLPPEQRVKDLLFAAVCRAINEHAGDGFMLIRRSDPANEPA